MQFAPLIYESPEGLAARENDDNDLYFGAWRAYCKALVDAGGGALELPETATIIQVEQGKWRVQEGPYTDTKEQSAGILVLDIYSQAAAFEWTARCPVAALGVVEVRQFARQRKQRITG